MNERIKLLAGNALDNAIPETWTTLTAYDLDKFTEKFAELIVKDCMAQCSELQAQYLTSRTSTMDFDEKNIYAEGEHACDILRFKMKQQFGVE